MPAGTILLRLAGAMGLVLLNGYFVAVEFAVVAVRRTQVESLAERGNAAARLALKLLDNPDRVIAASQLGITIASLALGWVGEQTVASLIEPPLEAWLGHRSLALAHGIGTVVAFALVTLTHIVLGEQVPKTVAVRYAVQSALTISGPMSAFLRVFRPLIALLDGVTSLVLRLFRVKPMSGHRAIFTLDELKMIVRESQEGGAIEADQEKMLQKVFEFGDRQVYEAMIPRPDVVGVDATATLDEFLRLFAATGHSRFPVIQGDLDNIVGILSAKDVLRALAKDPGRTALEVRDLAQPAFFVPGTVGVTDLLAQMRRSRHRMAVVLDEFGGTAGIVTLAALVEKIIGRLRDELGDEEEPVVQLDRLTVEIDAQLSVDEVNERLNLELPEGEEYETVAGLVLWLLQRIPEVGDTLSSGGVALRVTEMAGPKIEKVQIRRPESTAGKST